MIAVAEIKHPDIPKYQFLNVVNFKKDGLLENTFCSPVIATNDTVFNIGVVSMLCKKQIYICCKNKWWYQRQQNRLV